MENTNTFHIRIDTCTYFRIIDLKENSSQLNNVVIIQYIVTFYS
jgi:hypothetical protein